MWCHLQMWNGVYLCILFHHISSWWCSPSLPFTPPHHKLQKVTEMKCDEMHAMWCDVRLGDAKATSARTQFCNNVLTLMIFQSSKIPTTIYVHAQKLKVKRLKTLPSMYWWWWWWVSVFSFPRRRLIQAQISLCLSVCLESCCFFTLFLRFPRSMWSTQPPPMILSHFLELREICEAGLWTAFLLSQKLAKSLLPEEFWRLGWWHDNIIQLLSAVRS